MFEVLSIQARNKLARTMKAKAKMIAKKRERAMKKKANPEKLKKRAQKKAVDFIAKKILKDKDRSDLGQAGKASLEKKIKSYKLKVSEKESIVRIFEFAEKLE